MAILLMVNISILLMIIDRYSIGGYWCLLMAMILVATSGYSIVDIGGYFIGGY